MQFSITSVLLSLILLSGWSVLFLVAAFFAVPALADPPPVNKHPAQQRALPRISPNLQRNTYRAPSMVHVAPGGRRFVEFNGRELRRPVELREHQHWFGGHDYYHFTRGERAVWGRGHWYQEWHGGRYGWWWAVDGVWYFYPRPVYPYPVLAPEVAIVEPTLPAADVRPSQPAMSGPPPTQFWYYCDAPKGYYPYVDSCGSGWHQVPATPAIGKP